MPCQDLAIFRPTYKTLYWLHLPQCIVHRILTLMRNCLVGTVPSYLISPHNSAVSTPVFWSLQSAAHDVPVLGHPLTNTEVFLFLALYPSFLLKSTVS